MVLIRPNARVFMSGVVALTLAGCATQGGEERAPDSIFLHESGSSDPRRVDILPLLDMTWEAPDEDISHRYVGGYTRFQVVGDIPQGEESTAQTTVRSRRYNSEDRGPLARWLVGRSISRVVSIRVRLTQPDVSATTTLAAASQESNRTRGESWATEIHGRRMLTPYFRVDATTTAAIEANLNASSSIQGDVSGAFIDVLTRAAGLLAPSTTLVTSLTEERLDAASNFVDQSISTLFAQTLAEKTASEFRPGEWTEDLVTVTARFPLDRTVANDQNVEQIGSWTVSVEPAIVSIFSTVPLCDGTDCRPVTVQNQAREAFLGLAPHTVLNFRLDGQQTLVQALRGDEAIARALDTLTRTAAMPQQGRDAANTTAARILCNLIAGKAESLGFNRFDAAAVVWAVGFSDLVSNSDGIKLTNKETCISASLAELLGLDAQSAIEAATPSVRSQDRSANSDNTQPGPAAGGGSAPVPTPGTSPAAPVEAPGAAQPASPPPAAGPAVPATQPVETTPVPRADPS